MNLTRVGKLYSHGLGAVLRGRTSVTVTAIPAPHAPQGYNYLLRSPLLLSMSPLEVAQLNAKQSTIDFDPNATAAHDGIYGLPFDTDQAAQVIIPIPWEATVSYRTGTSKAPAAILEASKQVDLFDADVKDAWKFGLAMDAIPDDISKLDRETQSKVQAYLHATESGQEDAKALEQINNDCEKMNTWVRSRAKHFLDRGKLVYSIGGDHSTPLGLIQELAARGTFGILHIDAHSDTRDAYQGFVNSHASIMFNALKLKAVSNIVQVGIRDYCDEEEALAQSSNGRLRMFTDREIMSRLFDGESWRKICDSIIADLPQRVYLSVDIDGLDPQLCPSTGTPVPGGLQYEQTIYMVREVVRSGRTLIGLDLSEVAVGGDDDWDANVGARLLYRLANLTALSNKLQPLV